MILHQLDSLCQCTLDCVHACNHVYIQWYVPVCFDVSVHQPSHLFFMWVAAVAGELSKDQRHQDAVEEAVGDFACGI